MIPLWGYIAGGALVAVVSFGAGWQVRSWKAGSDQSAALIKASQALKKAERDINRVSGLYEQEKAAAQTTSGERQTVLREIFHENTKVIRTECAAPAAARSVLEDSVRAANTRARGEPEAEVPAATPPAKPARRSRTSAVGGGRDLALRRLCLTPPQRCGRVAQAA